MKYLKRLLLIILTLSLALGVAACSYPVGGKDGLGGFISGDYVYAPEALFSGKTGGRAGTDEVDGELSSDGSNQFTIPAGLITAAAWDDNAYFGDWLNLFYKGQGEEDSGKFSAFTGDNSWGFDSAYRVKVTAFYNGSPLAGAKVAVNNGQNGGSCAKTDRNGVAYVFPNLSEGSVTVSYGGSITEKNFDAQNRDISVDLGTGSTLLPLNKIKLMFVVDVTGSMGDELSYLRSELSDVIERIAAGDENTEIELALLFYRDNGDKEKFKYSDFVNVNEVRGLNKQLEVIDSQRATGGGDYPEAVDEALELAMDQNWGDDTSTKIIFHVLDAPPHELAENRERFNSAVKKAAELGIRVCPIICSGADILCEYLMRQAAVYTQGTFIFVTDDSGIGHSHLDPDLPNAVVEKLNDMLVRLVKGYHTGTFEEPVSWTEVIDTADTD